MLTYKWQFKNGSVGSIDFVDLMKLDFYVAYDYAMGDWICYER